MNTKINNDEFVDMSALTDLINERGVTANLWMSGGGCGTIYLGTADTDGMFDVAVGPSVYQHPAFGGASVGEWEAICYGRDGGEEAIYPETPRPLTQLADEIVAFYNTVVGANA